MKFVHPEILWALGALAVPIIVHLFNFRKFKKVFFPSVEFLREIRQETQSKSKLKHLLILMARMLAIACLVFAFAQPYFPVAGLSENPGGSVVSIYVDNSFSMESRGADGILLDLARNKAIEIAGAYKPSDKFQLLTSDFEGRHQRLVSREEMIQLIQEIELSPVSRKISEVVSRQKDMLAAAKEVNKRSFIITDLQQSIMDVEKIENDTSVLFTIVPEVAEASSNIYVDSIWFETPVRQLNSPEVLHARLVNTGKEERSNIPVQLLVNGMQKSVTTTDIEAEGTAEVSITFTNTEPGFKHCVFLIDDGGISKDDAFYFGYNVADKISILEIRGSSVEREAVQAVFSDDPYFNLTANTEGSIDYSSFNNQNLIVLNQLKSLPSGLIAELKTFADGGGSVLIIPASEILLNDYNDALGLFSIGQFAGKILNTTKVNSVNFDHFIFREAFQKTEGNIDLPGVDAYYELTISSKSGAEPMMLLQSGTPYMVSASAGDGRVYLVASSLNVAESNFINHAFFPATLLRIAEYSQPSARLSYALGMEQAILLRRIKLSGEETFRLKNLENESEFIPEHRNAGGNTELFVHADLQVAGNYSLISGNTEVQALSFNYDRKESDNHALTVSDVEAKLNEYGFVNWKIIESSAEGIAAGADELSDSRKYWLTMMVWALIFLAAEVLLIKFWR